MEDDDGDPLIILRFRNRDDSKLWLDKLNLALPKHRNKKRYEKFIDRNIYDKFNCMCWYVLCSSSFF